MSPPRKYFEKDSEETDIILASKQSTLSRTPSDICCDADPEGKLHVLDAVTEKHVCTYLASSKGNPVRHFGFFQSPDVATQSVMWCAFAKHTVGLTPWPFPSSFPSFCCHYVSSDEIRDVHICHDGKRLLTFDQSGAVYLWRIDLGVVDAQSRCPHEPTDFLPVDRLVELRKVFDAFQERNLGEDGVTPSQLEVIFCALGFFPSPAEMEDVLSEMIVQERRQFDREWKGRFSFAAIESLYVRYAHPIDTEKIEYAFSRLSTDNDEIFAIDFVKKLEEGTKPIEEDVHELMAEATGVSGDSPSRRRG